MSCWWLELLSRTDCKDRQPSVALCLIVCSHRSKPSSRLRVADGSAGASTSLGVLCNCKTEVVSLLRWLLVRPGWRHPVAFCPSWCTTASWAADSPLRVVQDRVTRRSDAWGCCHSVWLACNLPRPTFYVDSNAQEESSVLLLEPKLNPGGCQFSSV